MTSSSGDPFAAYAKKAQSFMDQPQRLVGNIRRRSDARERYVEIVAGLNACPCKSSLERYLDSVSVDVLQFHAELQFFWEGDGDFAGLQREIERAHVRVDDGLDHPRYEERGLEA